MSRRDQILAVGALTLVICTGVIWRSFEQQTTTRQLERPQTEQLMMDIRTAMRAIDRMQQDTAVTAPDPANPVESPPIRARRPSLTPDQPDSLVPGKSKAESDPQVDKLKGIAVHLKDEQLNRYDWIVPDIQFQLPSKVHLLPKDNPGKGWRFFHLVEQGLKKHPFATMVSNISEADTVFWLPTSTSQKDFLWEISEDRHLIILDEGDGSGYVPAASKMKYATYFKRSWVQKKDGVYKGAPRRLQRNYMPMVYSSSDEYHHGRFEGLKNRDKHVVCSLRCFDRQPARCRILQWAKDTVSRLGLQRSSMLGEVNHGGRKEINKGYFHAMRTTKIIVTCNPSHWEGDFRLWEAMLSGALVFVDEMWAPQPYALKHGEHVIVYDTQNQTAFDEKLSFYLENPNEARRIARQGYIHALRYHRAVSRMDYFLRSNHEQILKNSQGWPEGDFSSSPYDQTALQIWKRPSQAVLVNKVPANWKRR